MKNKTRITWRDIIEKSKNFDRKLKYYGVPRGGQPIAALLNPVDTADECDIIIDDIIDSGETKKMYNEKYPDKKFIALYDKQSSNKWIQFPWEVNEQPAEHNVSRILQTLGQDITREGLKNTPKRYIKFFREFLKPKPFTFTTFDSEGMDQMIIQKNIPFYSLCEHHLAPFFGLAHIAYIPNGKIVGLSKLARTLDKYARRLQNQERITQQTGKEIVKQLNPKGVAVSITAQHLCMSMRGIEKHNTDTTTTYLNGFFLTDDKARAEFISLINR